MTGRDRIVIMIVVVAVALAAVWIEGVSPERKQASKLSGQVASAQSQLASAEGQVSHARAAQSQYAAAYAAMVNLGKAVPPSQEVASLIYQLTGASKEKDVNFASIASVGGSGSAGTAAASGAADAAFTQLPFSFTFEGSYFDLEHLFSQLADFATLSASGNIAVSGRLLTIRSVNLSPAAGTTSSGTSATSELTGSITATAYVLPASQGLTGSASATSPTATGTGAGAAPASNSAPASSPNAPAIVKVNP